MTDLQTYAMIDGTPMLTIEQEETLAADLLIRLPIVSDHDSVRISARRLLAMIDSAAPDAMRAYLRETVKYEVPEADSPEDVDERPDRDDPTERAQLDRSWALELAVTLFSAGIGTTRAVEVADWILGPEAAQVEVLTLSGEDLNR